jgi:hypothetical protein
MNIKQMIKKLGGNRAAIAKASGTSEQAINNAVSRDVEVVELKDGRFVAVRADAVFYTNPGANNNDTL